MKRIMKEKGYNTKCVIGMTVGKLFKSSDKIIFITNYNNIFWAFLALIKYFFMLVNKL